jgi:hypothetical protein
MGARITLFIGLSTKIYFYFSRPRRGSMRQAKMRTLKELKEIYPVAQQLNALRRKRRALQKEWMQHPAAVRAAFVKSQPRGT